MSNLSRAKLDQIYDILVNVCGANESEREHFMYHHVDWPSHSEWRFCGDLGFGGKFRVSLGGTNIYVDCYIEDSTPERQAKIEQANAQLAAVLTL